MAYFGELARDNEKTVVALVLRCFQCYTDIAATFTQAYLNIPLLREQFGQHLRKDPFINVSELEDLVDPFVHGDVDHFVGWVGLRNGISQVGVVWQWTSRSLVIHPSAQKFIGYPCSSKSLGLSCACDGCACEEIASWDTSDVMLHDAGENLG